MKKEDLWNIVGYYITPLDQYKIVPTYEYKLFCRSWATYWDRYPDRKHIMWKHALERTCVVMHTCRPELTASRCTYQVYIDHKMRILRKKHTRKHKKSSKTVLEKPKKKNLASCLYRLPYILPGTVNHVECRLCFIMYEYVWTDMVPYTVQNAHTPGMIFRDHPLLVNSVTRGARHKTVALELYLW